MKIISTDKAPSAIGPYSQAVRINDIVYTSGQIPLSPETGEKVGGDISAQTEQVIKNIKAVLKADGLDLCDTIKTTCFLTDMANFALFNEVYAKYFTNKPARSCVAVSALPRDVLVEIEVIATKNTENNKGDSYEA